MNLPFLRLATALLAALSATPATAQIPPDAWPRAVALATAAATALAPPGARIVTQPGTLDPRLVLAPCGRADPYLMAGVPAWGRTRVGLRCSDGVARWSIFLPVTVEVWAPALASRVALPAGARLDAGQLQRADTDWAAATPRPITEADALAGRTLARAVAAGQALRSSDLQTRQWFASGDTVRIVARGVGYAVSAEGQALTPGLEGQPARVRTEAGKVLVGTPVGERRIEVGL